MKENFTRLKDSDIVQKNDFFGMLLNGTKHVRLHIIFKKDKMCGQTVSAINSGVNPNYGQWVFFRRVYLDN